MEEVKYVIVKGCGGLGNRLFTLSNAIAYAKRNGRTIHVDWSDNLFSHSGENIFHRFFDLEGVDEAELPETVESIYPNGYQDFVFDPIQQVCEQRTDHASRMSKLLGKQDVSMWYPKNDIGVAPFELGSDLPDSLNEQVVVYADYIPELDPDALRHHIKLGTDLQRMIDEFAERADLKHAIGVHVRSTDIQPSKGLPHLFRMIKSIDESARVFLATDNPAVETEFHEAGIMVVTIDKHLPEVTKESMGIHHWARSNTSQEETLDMLTDAITDMWSLAACGQLLYQGNSSFSQISNAIREGKNAKDWMV